LKDGEAEKFYVKTLGRKMPDILIALMPLGEEETGKCVASNSEKKLSLKTFNEDSQHADTIFLIKKV